MNYQEYKPTVEEMQATKSYKKAFQYSRKLHKMQANMLAKKAIAAARKKAEAEKELEEIRMEWEMTFPNTPMMISQPIRKHRALGLGMKETKGING